MKKSNKTVIKRIINKAIEEIKPEKVVLFGSQAYGKPNRDSDFDLLFIKNTKRKGIARYRWVDQHISHVVPMDILIRTPAEIKERLLMGDPFYKEIMTKGKVLYESA